ncbi:HAD family hydrolase [Pseudomonadota bacterium]
MNAVILDFDGVVVDSIEECYQVAKEAYFGFADIPVNEKALKEVFFKYRGIVRPAYQYLFLMRAIVENDCADRKNGIYSRFYELEEATDQSVRAHFETVFFGLRGLKQQDIQSWIQLNPLTEYGKTLVGKKLGDYCIVTTKDRFSVEQLLMHNNIAIDLIYDRDDYKQYGNKGEIITKFLDENEQYESAIFVDDAAEHLDTVKDSRVKNYFADWGYGENTGYEIFDPARQGGG